MTAAGRVWCLTCGRVATQPVPSLDDRHPLVLCVDYAPDGRPIGHGRVPGTADPDELADVLTANRRERVTRGHGSRKSHGPDNPDCYTCRPELVPARA